MTFKELLDVTEPTMEIWVDEIWTETEDLQDDNRDATEVRMIYCLAHPGVEVSHEEVGNTCAHYRLFVGRFPEQGQREVVRVGLGDSLEIDGNSMLTIMVNPA